jgi:hypothetical protein
VDLGVAVVGEMLATDLAGRVLPFDQAVAQAYAEIAAARRRAGLPIIQFDVLGTPASRPETSRISRAAA